METRVSCRKISNLKNDLSIILENIKWREIINPDEKVLIKPNLATKPIPGVTTSIEIINATIDLLREHTNDISIIETDSTSRSTKWLTKFLDFEVPFLNLSNEESMVVKGNFGSYNLTKLSLESKIVNIPVFKTHHITQVSFGLKNLFGLLIEKEKEKYHRDIDNVLFDLFGIFRPQINILDGIYSMDQKGPMDGRVRRTNFIIASNDALSLDMAACSIINLNPLKVRHMSKIHKEYPCSYGLSGDRIKIYDFIVPKPSRIDNFGVFLQNYTLTNWLLKQPLVRNFAKKVKSFLS